MADTDVGPALRPTNVTVVSGRRTVNGTARAEADTQPHIGYRPGLDGLRAVAVLAVMVQHATVHLPGGRGEALPGGFLGVDVFFVISGFLITSLLLAEHGGRGRIDLGRFWLRRARRLLPAVALTIAVTCVLVAVAHLPVDGRSTRGDALAALGYVANWHFILTRQSYFAAFGLPSPFRHLWSLSLEEQWYLVFPPVLLGALALAGRRRWLVVAGMATAAVASAAWMAALYRPGSDPSRVYYGTDTRAYTLLIGAVLAAVVAFWPGVVARVRPVLPAAAVAGAAGLAVAFRHFHGGEPGLYRGGLVLVALASVAVIAGVGLPDARGPMTWALSRRPLVAIGTISYGLYLWHWPIYEWLTPGRFGLAGPRLLAVRFAVTFGVAVLSYRLVERPIRHHGWSGVRARLRRVGLPSARPALLTAATGAAVAAVAVGATVTVPAAAPALAGQTLVAPAGWPVVTQVVPPHRALPAIPVDRRLRVLIGGDSVAWSIGMGLDHNPAGPRDVDMSMVANLGCTATPGAALSPDGVALISLCKDWRREWQQAAYTHQADLVLALWGPWEVYDHRLPDGEVLHPRTAAMAAAYQQALTSGIDGTVAARPDVRVALMTVPCLRERNAQLGGTESPRNNPANLAWVNQQTAQVARSFGGRVLTVDLGPLVCPGGHWVDRIGGVVVRTDGVHFSPKITPVVWAYVMAQVRPWLARPAVSGGA